MALYIRIFDCGKGVQHVINELEHVQLSLMAGVGGSGGKITIMLGNEGRTKDVTYIHTHTPNIQTYTYNRIITHDTRETPMAEGERFARHTQVWLNEG